MSIRSKIAHLVMAFLLVVGSNSALANEKVIGSGASFPFPIYSAWFKTFSQQTEGATIDYQAKGSGAGIKDFINGTVDFAASDAAMKPSEIAKVDRGVILLPMTAGEVVFSYNLPGVGSLNLPRDVYPQILLGKITKWNDPRLVKANPGVNMPNMDITVVRRADSSGTTYVLTNHLAAVSPEWKAGPGVSKMPQWPTGNFVAAPKNDGVALQIKQIPGAIGYIEYGYANFMGIPMAKLENQAGTFVAPGPEAGAEALGSVDIPDNLIVWATDPAGQGAYPIATFTWMLFYKDSGDPKKAAILREMIEFGLTEGQAMAEKMGYIPLPENVKARVRQAALEIK